MGKDAIQTQANAWADYLKAKDEKLGRNDPGMTVKDLAETFGLTYPSAKRRAELALSEGRARKGYRRTSDGKVATVYEIITQ